MVRTQLFREVRERSAHCHCVRKGTLEVQCQTAAHPLLEGKMGLPTLCMEAGSSISPPSSLPKASSTEHPSAVSSVLAHSPSSANIMR